MKKFFKNTGWFLFGIFIISALLLMSEKRDAELMKIKYCWNEKGTPFVAPNTECDH